MILISKITYVYEDDTRKSEEPFYLTVKTEVQLEKLCKILKEEHKCKHVNFVYYETD